MSFLPFVQIAWTRLHGFSGFMIWDLDLDDFFNNPEWCAQGRFPLINGMKAEWNNPTVDPCDVICPSGTPNNVPDIGCDSMSLYIYTYKLHKQHIYFKFLLLIMSSSTDNKITRRYCQHVFVSIQIQ